VILPQGLPSIRALHSKVPSTKGNRGLGSLRGLRSLSPSHLDLRVSEKVRRATLLRFLFYTPHSSAAHVVTGEVLGSTRTLVRTTLMEILCLDTPIALGTLVRCTTTRTTLGIFGSKDFQFPCNIDIWIGSAFHYALCRFRDVYHGFYHTPALLAGDRTSKPGAIYVYGPVLSLA
jgi:hypothetical protein